MCCKYDQLELSSRLISCRDEMMVLILEQLADNFTTFFDKLTEILDQVGRALPRYKEIRGIAPDDMSTRFRSSLVDLYRDLSEFFTSVAHVFTQKSGSKLVLTISMFDFTSIKSSLNNITRAQANPGCHHTGAVEAI